MKKIMLLPAIFFCTALLANNGKANKRKQQKAEKKEQANNKTESGNAGNAVSKGTPVVTYSKYKISRTGSKQVVPAE